MAALSGCSQSTEDQKEPNGLSVHKLVAANANDTAHINFMLSDLDKRDSAGKRIPF